MNRRPASCAVREAFRKEAEVALTRGQLSQRVVSAMSAEQARDDRRVDHRLALGDAVQGVDQDRRIEHALGTSQSRRATTASASGPSTTTHGQPRAANADLGIEAVLGVIAGGNVARGDGDPRQRTKVFCR